MVENFCQKFDLIAHHFFSVKLNFEVYPTINKRVIDRELRRS